MHTLFLMLGPDQKNPCMLKSITCGCSFPMHTWIIDGWTVSASMLTSEFFKRRLKNELNEVTLPTQQLWTHQGDGWMLNPSSFPAPNFQGNHKTTRRLSVQCSKPSESPDCHQPTAQSWHYAHSSACCSSISCLMNSAQAPTSAHSFLADSLGYWSHLAS